MPWAVSSNSPFYSTSDKRQGWLSPCTPTQPEKQVMEVTRGINSQACQLPWRAGCLRHARGSRSICSSGLHSATPQHFPSCTNHPAVGRQCRITKGQCWNTPGQRKNKTFQLLCNVMSHHVTFCCSNKVWWRDLWGLLCRPSKKTRTKLYNPQWASRLCSIDSMKAHWRANPNVLNSCCKPAHVLASEVFWSLLQLGAKSRTDAHDRLHQQVSHCLLSHTQIFLGKEYLVHSRLRSRLVVEWLKGNKILD